MFEGGNNTAASGKLVTLGRSPPASSSPLTPKECCKFCCWKSWLILCPAIIFVCYSRKHGGIRGRFQVSIKLNLNPYFWMQMSVIFFEVFLFYCQSELLGNLLKFCWSLCLSCHPYKFVTFVLRSALVIIASQVPA